MFLSGIMRLKKKPVSLLIVGSDNVTASKVMPINVYAASNAASVSFASKFKQNCEGSCKHWQKQGHNDAQRHAGPWGTTKVNFHPPQFQPHSFCSRASQNVVLNRRVFGELETQILSFPFADAEGISGFAGQQW